MRSLSWLVLLVCVAMARGQELVMPRLQLDSSMAREWLRGGDPRLIALAADYAWRMNDTERLAELPGLLARWAPSQIDTRSESEFDQRRAVLAILDALIQAKMQVPVGTIRAVAPRFPEQAAILVERIPGRDARWLLTEWVNGSPAGQNGQVLARAASMMLAKELDVGFVASMVAAAEEVLEVVVVRPGEGSSSGGGMGFTCGGIGGATAQPGWPPLSGYRLIENASVVADGTVVELDGDRIAYQRFEGDGMDGPCAPVEALDAVTRHRLIAFWLKVGAREMSWQPRESRAIVWKDQAAFERELGGVVAGAREKLGETARTLRERLLLREEDTAEPQLAVTIRCGFRPCPVRGARD